MSNVSFDLIKQAPCLGARLGVTVDGCKVWVSTILFAGELYTRVEADECEPCFYLGDIDTRTAAQNYIEGAPCAA